MKRNTLFLSLCILAAEWFMQACSSEDTPTVPEEHKKILHSGLPKRNAIIHYIRSELKFLQQPSFWTDKRVSAFK